MLHFHVFLSEATRIKESRFTLEMKAEKHLTRFDFLSENLQKSSIQDGTQEHVSRRLNAY